VHLKTVIGLIVTGMENVSDEYFGKKYLPTLFFRELQGIEDGLYPSKRLC
jgi:hypothetical protein